MHSLKNRVKDDVFLANVPSDLSLLASGIRACSADEMPEVPKGQGLAPSVYSDSWIQEVSATERGMKYKQMGEQERYDMCAMRMSLWKISVIAAALGRHRSTLYRELKRNRCESTRKYAASIAQMHANGRRRRSRRNLHFGEEEFAPIEVMVRGEVSPEQIVGRRRSQGQRVMSHETIYKWIWADKRRGGSLWRHLRGAQKQRRKRYRSYDSRGRLAGKKIIETRPAVVGRRKRIGDWEIDTVHGRGKASLVTIVERKTGVVRIGKLNRATMEQTLARTIRLLWEEQDLVKTITADNGCEFHNYKDLEEALDTKLYFATPHHAWERGTNENTNGLIRQYFPKGMNLSSVTQEQCEKVAEEVSESLCLGSVGFVVFSSAS